MLRPAAIASTLRNPTSPMPSFAGLAKNKPKKFSDLVQFLVDAPVAPGSGVCFRTPDDRGNAGDPPGA